MQIKTISISEPDFGIKPFNLERLGNLIVLIGKNGSGKSRFLNVIEDYLTEKVSADDMVNGKLSGVPSVIKKLHSEIEQYNQLHDLQIKSQAIAKERQSKPNDHSLGVLQRDIRNEIKTLKTNVGNPGITIENVSLILDDLNKKLQNEVANLRKNYVKRIKFSEIKELKDSISENIEDNQSFETLIETVTENLEYNELGIISSSSLKYLKKLPNQLVLDWLECKGDPKKLEKRISNLRFNALSDIFFQIFNKKLQWEISTPKKDITDKGLEALITGHWTINDREFNFEEFSDGEKTLFIYVLLFFLISQNSNLRLKQSILIIDEPELHLHADAEIELLNAIRNIIGEQGQLWIATHSINILAHVNFDEVFVIKENEIHRPSRTIQREALSELLAIQHRVDKLSEFLSCISEWSYVNFIVECFTNPDVIETPHSNDPQIIAFKEVLKSNLDLKQTILLDYGSGKGRLLDQTFNDREVWGKFKYCALEPNELFHEILKEKGVSQVFSNYMELESNSFDFIVMCNVLHEIPVNEWASNINKIIDSLNSSGFFVFLEAKTLSKGEYIRDTGFLLLNEDEIAKLLNIDGSITSIKIKNKGNNIVCVAIEKQYLKPISNIQVLDALELLETNTMNKIRKLKSKPPADIDSNNIFGRELAFLSQLYIHAIMGQEAVRKNESETQNKTEVL